MAEETALRQPKYEFRKFLEPIARRKSSPLEVFRDFATMAACSLAMQTREEEYLQIAGKYERKELGDIAKALGALVVEMEEFPFTDLLGHYYCEVNAKSGRDQRGEFYTPREVNKLMARMSVNTEEIVEKGLPFTMNEPACGSGGIVLALAEELAPHNAVDLMRVTAQDISKVGCDMAYVNLTLWAIPAHIIWGDTLRNTVNESWKNIHWARVGEDSRLVMKQAFDLVRKGVASSPEEPEPISESTSSIPPAEEVNQQWLFGGPDVS
ncbi:N-6 DNA methylase [Roseibacillus persicicus]|uniref:site-specific DNA-methyltransferase (adenine-specific) n=1 Tax=Roseibacillus persicicus TaxID=454148 RepID=A0A918WL16_9BACT|nr:N-6 DNA methylase [Roseibacillus persicicus]GHC56097.1 hypothetical protein GCM10007100_23740 [Roseibacillus persicicus]